MYLVGAYNTIMVSYLHLRDSASIILTGSVADMIPGTVDNPANGPGGADYALAKRAIVQLVHDLSVAMAEPVPSCRNNTGEGNENPMCPDKNATTWRHSRVSGSGRPGPGIGVAAASSTRPSGSSDELLHL